MLPTDESVRWHASCARRLLRERDPASGPRVDDAGAARMGRTRPCAQMPLPSPLSPRACCCPRRFACLRLRILLAAAHVCKDGGCCAEQEAEEMARGARDPQKCRVAWHALPTRAQFLLLTNVPPPLSALLQVVVNCRVAAQGARAVRLRARLALVCVRGLQSYRAGFACATWWFLCSVGSGSASYYSCADVADLYERQGPVAESRSVEWSATARHSSTYI